MLPSSRSFQRFSLAYAMTRERHHDVSTLHTLSSAAIINDGLLQAVQFCSNSRLRGMTPYTGTAGLAYALWRAGSLKHNHEWQQQAHELAASALRKAAHLEDASLLDGESAGLLSL